MYAIVLKNILKEEECMIKELSIIGCGGHARSVADVVLNNNSTIKLNFYDTNAYKEERILGGTYTVLPLNINTNFEYTNLFIAIGNNLKRRDYTVHYLKNTDQNLVTIISHTAYISRFSDVKQGCFVAENVHIGPECEIGKCTIVNTRAVIDHESKIGKYCHISVNSTVCGRCTIGDNVFLGAGAVVKDKINICDNVTIGAGAVVCADITESGLYVGCPAKKIR